MPLCYTYPAITRSDSTHMTSQQQVDLGYFQHILSQCHSSSGSNDSIPANVAMTVGMVIATLVILAIGKVYMAEYIHNILPSFTICHILPYRYYPT